MISPYLIALIFGIVIFELIAQYCLKCHQKKKNYFLLVAGCLLFAGMGFLISLGMEMNKIAIVNIMWGATSIILLTTMAYFFFHEKLTLLQLFGILVVFIGMILLHFGSAA